MMGFISGQAEGLAYSIRNFNITYFIDLKVMSFFSFIVEAEIRWDIFLLGLLFILFISLGSYGLGMNIRDTRKKELEKLVKERTKELEKTNEELKQRNSELDRFVYSASHDLSSPLKSILGLINVAKLEKPDAQQLLYLNMMEKSVDKLESFIEEVIQYSRNARLPIKNEELEFKPFVKEIIHSYQYLPNYDKIQIEVEDSTGLPLYTDRLRLKIILNNLISNAIKFHRVTGNQQAEIRIKRMIADEYYIIVVTDNGSGIQPEYLDKIFDMFFRGTEGAPGSGLGLYILKEIVTKLDGKIEVVSKVGEGSVFTVSIPSSK